MGTAHEWVPILAPAREVFSGELCRRAPLGRKKYLPRHKSMQRRSFSRVLLITNAWGCHDPAVPQEALDVTVRTRGLPSSCGRDSCELRCIGRGCHGLSVPSRDSVCLAGAGHPRASVGLPSALRGKVRIHSGPHEERSWHRFYRGVTGRTSANDGCSTACHPPSPGGPPQGARCA